MDTAAAEQALRENALTVKGKGGKVRIVPIEDDRITMMLQQLLDKTERGHMRHSHTLLRPDDHSECCQQFGSIALHTSETIR